MKFKWWNDAPSIGPTVINAMNFKRHKATMTDIVNHLESFQLVKRPVLDETGLDDKYAISLELEAENPESLKIQFANYGLALKKDKHSIEFLVIEKQ